MVKLENFFHLDNDIENNKDGKYLTFHPFDGNFEFGNILANIEDKSVEMVRDYHHFGNEGASTNDGL